MNFKSSSKIDEFILSNTDALKSRCMLKKTSVIDSVFGSKIETHMEYDSNMLKKWWHFMPDNLSTEFKEILCFYCEVLYLFDQNCNINSPMYPIISPVDIRNELGKVLSTLSKKSYRSKIIDRYYNYGKNCIEYLLEDGNYVTENSKGEYLKPDLSIFPDSFVKLIDEQEYRNIKIQSII